MVFRKPLFFLAELGRVRLPAAPRKSHRMLQVQHLVKHHVSKHVFGHLFSVELAIDYDLFERGIEAPKLRPPGVRAPSQPGFAEGVLKVFAVQPRKKKAEVVMLARRPVIDAARPPLPQSKQTLPRRLSVRKLAVVIQHVLRGMPPIQPAE